MSKELFHQVGHNANWSISSLTEDFCGNGLILSPVHQDRASIERLGLDVRRVSYFDPQYYLPSSQKSKLKSYEFFPETILSVIGGFDTTSYLTLANESAKKCIDFQMQLSFRTVVIPARFISQMRSDFIEQHEAFSVIPFLEAATQAGQRTLCMTLPLTHHMIEDVPFRKNILNWITKYPEIDEIYLIYSVERDTKQLQSPGTITALLDFCQEIADSGLKLLVGYQNTESLLFTLIEQAALSIGTFENTRIFSIDKFLVTDEERRGPKPRIYLPGLLNWVQFDQAKLIRQSAPRVWERIHKPTDYSERVLARTVDPHFNQPELYKHQLICLSEQIQALSALRGRDRKAQLHTLIRDAARNYEEIDDVGILIEKHGGGNHLSAWNIAVKNSNALS